MTDGRILVFYDGRCGLCRRSIRVLHSLDWLGKLRPVNFQNDDERRRHAPDISYTQLHRAMHVRFPGGRTLTGFSAFRALCWRLPLLWLLAPMLYAPGVKLMGDSIYARIAERRNRCTHASCGAPTPLARAASSCAKPCQRSGGKACGK